MCLDQVFEVTNGSIPEAIGYLKSIFGEALHILPLSGQSAGGGVFTGERAEARNKIIGLLINAPIPLTDQKHVAYTLSDQAPNQALKTHEVHINKKDLILYTGSGVILNQLNETVKEALGKSYTILGTDLTSKDYASAGGTFMTGGMGPSRINFGKNVLSVNIFNGKKSIEINETEALAALVETYGATGFVGSLQLPIVKIPHHAFGFALPVQNTPKELAAVVDHFAVLTKFNVRAHTIHKNLIVFGIEIISKQALELAAASYPDMDGLSALLSNCIQSKKDAVVFIIGQADEDPFENPQDPLGIFHENKQGLNFEQAMPFYDLQALAHIREGAPDLSRAQFNAARFTYKDHTDITIKLNPNKIYLSLQAVMTVYQNYQNKLQTIFKTEGLQGNIQVYGHLNPQGINPHYRITMASENEFILSAAVKLAKKYFEELIVALNKVCNETSSELTGGEKGFISNRKIMQALKKNNQACPSELEYFFKQQERAIQLADPMFNWRLPINPQFKNPN